jgi:hypothetical protein
MAEVDETIRVPTVPSLLVQIAASGVRAPGINGRLYGLDDKGALWRLDPSPPPPPPWPWRFVALSATVTPPVPKIVQVTTSGPRGPGSNGQIFGLAEDATLWWVNPATSRWEYVTFSGATAPSPWEDLPGARPPL